MNSTALDSLLTALTVEVDAFAICEIGEHARIVWPPFGFIEVHHVLEGTLHLSIGEEAPVRIEAGGMAIVPPHSLQYLAASPNPTASYTTGDVCLPAREGMLLLNAAEGAKPALRVACGKVRADLAGSYGPLDGLSRVVAEDLRDEPIVSVAFSTMLRELALPVEGTRALTCALMKACLIVLLRRHFQSARAGAVPPALLQHTRLGKAIATVLDRPAKDHSVTSLASVAGMSRAAFARDFKLTIGTTPMEFVIRTRLAHARGMLASTAQPISAIASISGFASRSHFSRAFREAYGVDPSAYRRRDKNCEPNDAD